MKKFLKIVAIVAVVLIAVALVVPLALKSKVGDIVKKEAGELLTAEVDFRSLDLSLLRHFPHASVEFGGVDGRLRCAVRRGYAGFGRAHLGGRRPDVALRRFGLRGDKLLVDKAHLHARKLADGSVNWDVMKPSDEPAEEKERPRRTSRRPSVCGCATCVCRRPSSAMRTTRRECAAGGRSARPAPERRPVGERSDLDLRLEAHRLSYGGRRGGAAARRRSDGRRHARRRI